MNYYKSCSEINEDINWINFTEETLYLTMDNGIFLKWINGEWETIGETDASEDREAA